MLSWHACIGVVRISLINVMSNIAYFSSFWSTGN
jgi:hypothetical protein